jgi:hypothetical protein
MECMSHLMSILKPPGPSQHPQQRQFCLIKVCRHHYYLLIPTSNLNSSNRITSGSSLAQTTYTQYNYKPKNPIFWLLCTILTMLCVSPSVYANLWALYFVLCLHFPQSFPSLVLLVAWNLVLALCKPFNPPVLLLCKMMYDYDSNNSTNKYNTYRSNYLRFESQEGGEESLGLDPQALPRDLSIKTSNLRLEKSYFQAYLEGTLQIKEEPYRFNKPEVVFSMTHPNGEATLMHPHWLKEADPEELNSLWSTSDAQDTNVFILHLIHDENNQPMLQVEQYQPNISPIFKTKYKTVDKKVRPVPGVVPGKA